MGIKTAIAEQNAIPGITNKILGRFSNKIFLAFSETKRFFSGEKVVVAGNPVRTGFVPEQGAKEGNNGKFTLLIFGGSQGASSINMAVMESLEYMEGIKDTLKVIHQTGEKDLNEVAGAYSARGIDAEVLPFITDMAGAYRRADLLVCRAGATSIAEITALGKAALFIPYPFAAGNHQELNARMLVDAGAALMITEDDLDGRLLFEMIEELYGNPARREKMEGISRGLGNIKAASTIVDGCLDLIGQ
jgi:UDP-N-acetylglucosamine--N-acetylmuramyl-(pentapeptide) pyrophosphoryl-undecaprenol N-acetylglucosamine transferase